MIRQKRAPAAGRLIEVDLKLVPPTLAEVAGPCEGTANGHGQAGDRQSPDPEMGELAAVRNHIRLRRLREKLLPAELFSDPAWDILLDLYASGLEGKPVSVMSACIASITPSTTALRWLNRLIECNLVERCDDPADARRIHVHLTAVGRQAVKSWVGVALLNGR